MTESALEKLWDTLTPTKKADLVRQTVINVPDKDWICDIYQLTRGQLERIIGGADYPDIIAEYMNDPTGGDPDNDVKKESDNHGNEQTSD